VDLQEPPAQPSPPSERAHRRRVLHVMMTVKKLNIRRVIQALTENNSRKMFLFSLLEILSFMTFWL
jgi:hypothetical protein